MYNVEGAPFSSDYYSLVIVYATEAVQSWHGKNRVEFRLGGSGDMVPQEILKFSFTKMHISRNLRDN